MSTTAALFTQLASLTLHAAQPATDPSIEAGKQAPASTEKVRVGLRGVMLINMSYNTSGIFPGSQAAFALRPDIGEAQFFISPQNSSLGIDLSASPIAGAEIVGALAITLRSPQPFITANSIAPQFYDVHLEARTRGLHLAFGQMPDVVYPATPDVLNAVPPGYLPGAIGYTRPQLQGGIDVPLGDVLTLLVRGSLAQPIQTFDVADTLVGRQAGVPDFQGRMAVGTGEPVAAGAVIRPRERPIEVGVDGHWGRRRITSLPPNIQNFTFTTWSVGGDLHVKLPTRTTLRGEIFVGSLLGDYGAGVFHTVDPTLLVAVRAWGFWAQIVQSMHDRFRVGVAYGLDDPNRDDLAPITRARNEAVLVTGFWQITGPLGVGAEASRWWTQYVGQSSAASWRGDVAVFLGFGGP